MRCMQTGSWAMRATAMAAFFCVAPLCLCATSANNRDTIRHVKAGHFSGYLAQTGHMHAPRCLAICRHMNRLTAVICILCMPMVVVHCMLFCYMCLSDSQSNTFREPRLAHSESTMHRSVITHVLQQLPLLLTHSTVTLAACIQSNA